MKFDLFYNNFDFHHNFRPRAIALGTIFLIFGLVSMVLPHFIYPPYEFVDLNSKSNNLTEKMMCR